MRLTPRGGRDALEGLETRDDGMVVARARVRAAPEDGRANTALEKLVASALGAAPRDVRVASGATSRTKTLHIAGDPSILAAGLERTFGKGAP